jgi:sarcosine oxidase
MGAATLRALAARGVAAVGVDRFRPGHAHGSSHGETRVFRIAYFEHPAYEPLALAARDASRRIERETGAALLTTTGILEAGFEGSPIVSGSLEAARRHGLPHEVLSAREASARFPAFDLPDGWIASFQPDGGVLRAEASVEAMVASAVARGASVLVERRVAALVPQREGVRVVFDDGSGLTADRVVVGAGPWIGALAPGLAPALRVTRQTVGWFAPRQADLVRPAAMPVFILQAPEDTFYGFPDMSGSGVKTASHIEGDVVADPDARVDANGAALDRLAANLARYLPAAAGPLRAKSSCFYTRTADEHFAIGLHPGDARIVLASPCSGHGFKFASLIGEILADLALDGGTRHDIGLFDLGRCFAGRPSW